MSSTELFALLDRAQSGDDEACRQVLTENAGLIWSIVRRYSGCGVETDDLYQLGCIGFIKAVKGFDLHYGTQFSTYAVPKIAGEIRRFLRDDGAVKVGRTIRERGQTLWSVRERLRGGLPVVDAPAFAKKAECIGAFSHPSAQRRVPAPPHMECRCAAASPRSRRARTQLALMCGKMRHRLPPLCTEASDCETEASEPIPPKPFSRFGATYRETPRQKAAKRFSLRTKNVCGAQPQMLFVHPFFFASR